VSRYGILPIRPARLVDVDVGIHQPRQNGGIAKVLHGSFCGQLIPRNNIQDSSVFDKHRRRFDPCDVTTRRERKAARVILECGPKQKLLRLLFRLPTTHGIEPRSSSDSPETPAVAVPSR